MLNLEVKVMNGMWRTKNKIAEKVHNFFVDEKGDTNLISIVIVLVIVLGMAVVFRKTIASMVNEMWKSIIKDFNDATNTNATTTQFPD